MNLNTLNVAGTVADHYYDIRKDTEKIHEKYMEKYAQNGLITGHLGPFLVVGSIGNEFAASISSSLSPPRSSRASKVQKISQKNCWAQFLRWQLLSLRDSSWFLINVAYCLLFLVVILEVFVIVLLLLLIYLESMFGLLGLASNIFNFASNLSMFASNL